jgi:hypothetical protein
VWGSEFTIKAAALQGGLIVVLRPLLAAALVVRQAVSRGAARFFRSLAVLSTQVSAVGLRLRLVVPRPTPAAVASRSC